MDVSRHHAAFRFGLGARPDQPLPDDPPRALLAELTREPGPLPLPEGWDHQPTMVDIMAVWDEELATRDTPMPGNQRPRAALARKEMRALVEHCLATPDGFRERLVLFWTNHFTASRRSGNVQAFLGDYMRRAIRPHVAGSFADMLVATTWHPAMLYYLNQSSSVGPNSLTGRRAQLGLNENLGREILELHTLSPAAGYSQADVTSFAKLLTGLTVQRRNGTGTIFAANRHEPGPKRVFGEEFGEGAQEIERALRWLAVQESTQRHLAIKLVRHFVDDTPPPAAVQKVFSTLRDSRSDIGAAARTLVDMPETWQKPLAKLKTPQEFAFAALRGLGAGPRHAPVALRVAGSLGQQVWLATDPIGWPDRAEDWVTPEGVLQRMEQAHDMAGRFSRLDPMALAETTLGPLARPETLQAARRAGSQRDGLTLVLASPEFQRR
ncbi:hypothetical protein BKE38_04400 [Pseudoroseomonas deserti]|uniref:DUF1800 domain-containing protein n=1 Tax=Teichococcus deserti TaxID=1817963 RepID=A0A1V2H775_9PROT|nr:DUF1800 domain-containing protein [Pseudoroseomonas deserti]ONG57294.1 hypothetical protein BKE38_04400 [Pseudoroseomonas deserti]